MSGNFSLSPAQSRQSAKRGCAKLAGIYLIDGTYYTADQLAEKLGVDKQKALKKWSRVKNKPGPMTWAKLGIA